MKRNVSCIHVITILIKYTEITYRSFLVDTDECVSEPCQNNGTCTEQINGYECQCVAGFNGTNCENSKFHQSTIETKIVGIYF